MQKEEKELTDMEMTERMHAFLAGYYYREIISEGFSDGNELFLKCVEKYGNERGERMARRARRDGKPLTYSTYAQYREWNASASSIAENSTNLSECTEVSPDYTVHYTRCPWAAAFQEMNEIEGARLYCSAIDRAVIHGFNPQLKFQVKGCLAADPECVQTWVDAGVTLPFAAPSPSDQKDWGYHCAHLFWTFGEVLKEADPEKGKAAEEKVLKMFEERFGKEASDTVLAYRDTPFSGPDSIS